MLLDPDELRRGIIVWCAIIGAVGMAVGIILTTLVYFIITG